MGAVHVRSRGPNVRPVAVRIATRGASAQGRTPWFSRLHRAFARRSSIAIFTLAASLGAAACAATPAVVGVGPANRVIVVPSSIDPTGRTNVTDPLQRFL